MLDRKRIGLWARLGLCVAGLLLALSWLRFHRAGRAQAVVPPNSLTDFASTLPRSAGPTGYVTSASCEECHAKQYDSWHRSYHRSMTQIMSPRTVQADFENVPLELNGERFSLERRGEEYRVTIEDLEGDPTPGGARAKDEAPLRIRMGLVTGSHHMQVFWLPAGFGNAQIGFPFTWLIDDQRWVPRNDTFIRDPTASPSKELWNMTCIRCHTTLGRPRPDKERQVYDTQAVQLGIACEACHGPAENHVELQRRRARIPRSGPGAPQEVAIVHPGNLPPKRASQICGFCHAIKWFDKSEGWEQHGFRYRPGDDLEKTTPIVRPGRLESQPWLKPVLEKHPELFNDFFWPDGMIRVAGREYNGLIESACYERGEMSCLSCHSMHKSDPNLQLARGMESNEACFQCHQPFRANISGHTHHPADSSGSLCYNCHMPHTSYGLLRAIRSHQISSPNVRTSIQSGRPNACNLCHLDQTLAWTESHLSDWFGQRPENLGPDERNISAALLWLLRGDAGQRALIAWSMGWTPAREASGAGWMAPFLSTLLIDPYAAIRYIAGRSLRRLPEYHDIAYDFVGPESNWAAARKKVLDTWKAGGPGTVARSRAAVLIDAGGDLQEEQIERLLRERNDRPLHLRE